jgi:N6-adenosine-specific RNA methylase IME4
MDGKKADMVFTDPPYGVDYDGGHATEKRREKLQNDDDVNMYDLPVKNAFLASNDDAALYLWFSDSYASEVITGLNEAGYQVRSWIVWNKNVAQFGAIGAQYKMKHEPCIYAFKKGKSPNWNGPTNEVTVWDVARDHRNEHHPTHL